MGGQARGPDPVPVEPPEHVGVKCDLQLALPADFVPVTAATSAWAATPARAKPSGIDDGRANTSNKVASTVR